MLKSLVLVALLTVFPLVCRAQTAGKPSPPNSQSAESNAKAAHIDDLFAQSKLAAKNKDWKKLEEISRQLIIELPDCICYSDLGDAQLNLGEYEESIKSYEKALEIAGMTTWAPPGVVKEENRHEYLIAKMLTSEGNAYLKLHKNEDAIRLFTRAAEMSPKTGTAYFNICATLYNLGDMERAVPACRKAIDVDPARADAYFVLGSILFSNGKLDSNNTFVAPEGTLQALKKYLELAPDGPHAKDVKDMLDMLAPKK